MHNLISKIEAILFISGEAVNPNKIVSLLGEDEENVKKALLSLKEQLSNDEKRGLQIIELDSGYQMVTKPEMGGLIESIAKDEIKEDLSPATLETLSLIAYLEPISKPAIEYIRGVNSGFIIRNLLIRGLVDKFPNPEKAGSWLYRVTPELLKHLGISSTEDLPEIEKYREMRSIFENKEKNDKNET